MKYDDALKARDILSKIESIRELTNTIDRKLKVYGTARVISDYNSSSILVVNRKSNLHVDILNALQREKKRLEDKIKSMNDENDYYVADFSGHNI